MDNLTLVFKEHNLKLTPQRIAVYKYLKGTTEHPSAETIYTALHEDYPTMSLATLYKALKTLTEVGLIQELNLGENNFRYDANTSSHPHVKCINCGRVDDIMGLDYSTLVIDAERHSDYTILSDQVYFFGVCSNCQKKKTD